MCARHSRGFSLIEILIVIAIVIFLSFFTVQTFHSLASTKGLDANTQRVLADLNKARSLTLASLNADTFGVHFESDRVTLFEGASFATASSTDTVDILDPSVTIAAVTLAGGGSDVVFQRLTGDTNASGFVELSLSSSSSVKKIITIYQTGTVDAQ